MIENPVSAYYKYCNKLPVIDIGCGTIKYFDFDYVRFDRSKVYVMWGDSMKLTTTHYGDFHDMSEFKDNHFEYVICCRVTIRVFFRLMPGYPFLKITYNSCIKNCIIVICHYVNMAFHL